MFRIDTRSLVALALIAMVSSAAAQEPAAPAAPAGGREVGDIWKPTREGVSDEASAKIAAQAQSAAGDAPGVMVDGILTDRSGRTVYRFDRDRRDVSTCHRICAQLWPPFAAGADAVASGDFTLIERADGALQWAWRGHPLYLWVHDTKPGDVTGDDVNEVWHVVRDGDPRKR